MDLLSGGLSIITDTSSTKNKLKIFTIEAYQEITERTREMPRKYAFVTVLFE